MCVKYNDLVDATIEFNDDLDEATASLLDLNFLAIIKQQERQQQYQITPTNAFRQEIATHAQYNITFA